MYTKNSISGLNNIIELENNHGLYVKFYDIGILLHSHFWNLCYESNQPFQLEMTKF